MASFMTTAEVAELARTSPETVRYWRHVGKGPAGVKVGRKVLYDRDEVARWLRGLASAERQRVGGAA